MNIKTVAAVAALSGVLVAGAASAQSVNVGQNAPLSAITHHYRGERGSSANIRRVRREVERSIDQLQNDSHDFGGHRAQAVELLQQARAQLLLAEQYDRQHPGH